MAGRIELVEPEPEPDRSPAPDPSAAVDPEPARDRPGRRRTVLLLVLAAAVVVGLLVARAVSSDGPSAAPPIPSVSAVSSAPQPPATAVAVPGALDAVLGSRPGAVLAQYCPGSPGIPAPGTVTDRAAPRGPQPLHGCAADAAFCPEAGDGQNACASDTSVPASVLRVVRAHYPDATLALTNTEVVRETGGLWYRLMLFSLAPGRTLRIDVVQRHADLPRSGERSDASGLIARAVGVRGTLATLVTLGGPGASANEPSTISALSAEPGLAALR